jgi:glutathione S-transferase
MTYELFYSPGSCSMAAHIVLQEVGADFSLHLISVMKGETAGEPYLSINPKGRVPVLRIAGEPKILTELPAILLFLARRYPEFELIPAGNPLPEARCAEWLAWLAGWVHAVGFGLLWRPGRLSGDPTHHETLVARGREIIEAAYSEAEKTFRDGRGWALGDVFSIVDPFLLVLHGWGNRIGLPMQELYPQWTSAVLRTAKRPAVAQVLKREGVSVRV